MRYQTLFPVLGLVTIACLGLRASPQAEGTSTDCGSLDKDSCNAKSECSYKEPDGPCESRQAAMPNPGDPNSGHSHTSETPASTLPETKP